MLDFLYDRLNDSQVAVVIISLSIMLMSGFLMTRLTKKVTELGYTYFDGLYLSWNNNWTKPFGFDSGKDYR